MLHFLQSNLLEQWCMQKEWWLFPFSACQENVILQVKKEEAPCTTVGMYMYSHGYLLGMKLVLAA